MSELVVGSIAGLASNSYEVGIASGSTLDLANAKAGSLPPAAMEAPSGLVPIHSQTYTGVASVSIDNVFTSAYKNYKLSVTQVQSDSTSTQLSMRLRAGGSTLSDTNYMCAAYGWYGTGSSFSDQFLGVASARIGRLKDTGVWNNYSLDIYNPNESFPATWWGGGFGLDNATWFTAQFGGAYTPTTQADGIYLFPNVGSFARITVSIYGYAEAA